MHRLFGGVLLLVAAGCGSGENAVAVTPVIADTKGTYRLVASRTSLTRSGAAGAFSSYSGGILRLDDPSYSRVVSGTGRQSASGAYRLGVSVNSTLNSSHGTFSLTSSLAPFVLTGSYQVTPDFTLTLDYDGFVLPEGVVTLSETWYKESDSPRH